MTADCQFDSRTHYVVVVKQITTFTSSRYFIGKGVFFFIGISKWGFNIGAQLRSQPILRWAIAQLRILSWVAYLKIEHISST